MRVWLKRDSICPREKESKMGFSQWANGEGTLWGMLWRWKSVKDDRWCIELFTTHNGWLHSVREQVMSYGHQQDIFVFEIPVAEFFARADTNYPRLPIDEVKAPLAPSMIKGGYL